MFGSSSLLYSELPKDHLASNYDFLLLDPKKKKSLETVECFSALLSFSAAFVGILIQIPKEMGTCVVSCPFADHPT